MLNFNFITLNLKKIIFGIFLVFSGPRLLKAFPEVVENVKNYLIPSEEVFYTEEEELKFEKNTFIKK